MKRADDIGLDLVIGTIEDARRDTPAVEQSGASPLAIRQGLAHHHSRGAVLGPSHFYKRFLALEAQAFTLPLCCASPTPAGCQHVLGLIFCFCRVLYQSAYLRALYVAKGD